VKNAKKGNSWSFKIIEDGINWKPICDFLLVINTNRHLISYHFGVIAAYCSNFGHCIFQPPFARLTGNIWCSSLAHWKVHSEHPISVNSTFLQGVTAEALRVKIDRKSVHCKWVGHHPPNFRIEGDVPHQSFLHSELGQWMPYNTVADSFHTKKLCSRLSSSEVRFCYAIRLRRYEHQLKIGNFAPMGAGWPKISSRRGRPQQPFFFSEN